MPISDSLKINYENGLRSFISNPDSGFSNIGAENYGLGVNQLTNIFAQKYNIPDEDRAELSEISQSVLQDFKSLTNTPRFIPKEEDFPTYYTPLQLNPDDAIENKIAAIDKWKSDSLAKSSALRPSESTDFKFHLEGIANNFITQEVAKDNKTTWAGDKVYRTIESFARMGTSFADFEWANRFLAENLPQDPERDQDLSSLFASGIGELTSQALTAVVTSATVGPEAVPYALASIYTARAMKEGYDEQFSRDGNAIKAMDASIASIPGALLETVADSLLFKGGSALRKSFADEFLQATTDAAKREVLKRAMPEIGKEVLKNGISEATIGSVGADFTTGYGRYLATGDASYIPSPEDLMKGALVEGVLGAGYTGVTSGGIRNDGAAQISQEMFQQNLQKQGEIFTALRSGNYDEAVRIANFQTPEKTSTPTASVDSSTQEAPASVNTSRDFSMPFSSASRIAETAKNLRASGNIAEADRLDSVANSIRSGSYVMPDLFNKNTSFVGEEISATPDTGVTANDITLEDGTILPKDKNIVFVQGVTPNSVAEINERFGGVSLLINQNTPDKAALVWKENGVNKKTSDFRFSTTPRKNFIPVEIPNLTFLNDSTAVSSSFAFVKGGAVASYKKTDASKGIIRQNPQASNNTNVDQEQINREVELISEDQGLAKAMEVLDALESNKVAEYAGNFEADLEEALDGLRDYSNRMEAEGNTDAFIAANETAESIISLYSDLKQPTQRWPIPRTSNITRPTNIFTEQQFPAVQDGPLVEYEGVRGNLTTTPEGLFVGDILVSNNPNMPVNEIEGLRVIEQPNTEFTLGPDSSGRMYKFENGTKVYQDGESVRIVNRKGNRTGLNPVVEPQRPDYVSVNTSVEAAQTLTENPAAIVVHDNVETSNFQDQTPANPTVDELQAQQNVVSETQDEVDNFNNSAVSEEIAEQVTALQENNVNTIPELLAAENVAEEVKDSVLFKEPEQPSFRNLVEDFISSITNEKGKAAWNGKLDDAVAYYEGGANFANRGSLSEIQARALDRLIQQYDSSLAKQIRKDAAKDDKLSREVRDAEKSRFSNASNNPRTERISWGQAVDALAKRGLSFIELFNTAKVGPTGLPWKGRTKFSSNADTRIMVNIANIYDEADLNNTVNEEIGHVIYNNPDLRSSLDSIVSNTPIDRNLLNLGYTEADLLEESVTKRFADLIDQYNEKGTWDKLLTSIRAYVKDLFGFELNDSDLQYIASRALSRALKNPDLLKLRANRDGTVSRYSFDDNYSIRSDNDRINGFVADLGNNIKSIKKLVLDFLKQDISIDILKINPSSFNSVNYVIDKNLSDYYDLGESNETLYNLSSGDRIDTDSYFYKRSQELLKKLQEKTSNYFTNDELESFSEEFYKLYRNVESDVKYLAEKVGSIKDVNDLLEFDIERFSLASNNTNAVAFEESEVLSQINGLISPRVKEIRKRLNGLIRSKLEQKLIISEPENWKALKTMQFQYLNEADLDIYKDIVDDFANTRRKIRGGPIETTQRYNQDELRDELSRLNKAAEQGRFDFLQRDNEFLQNKDFQRDYDSDLDKVEQAVKDVNLANDNDSGNPNQKLDDRDEYIFKIIELQDVASENAKYRFDEAFSEVQPNETGSEIVNKYLPKFKAVTDSHVAKERARAEQTYNALMTDPSELSFKQARQRYYSLMSFISDGYMLNASNFISEETTAILNAEVADSDRIVPFNSRTGMALFQNSASFATNIRRLGNKMADLMFKLTTPFRTGVENAERIQSEFIRPALTEAQAAAEKVSGKKYTSYDQNIIGLYTLGKNYKTSETVAQGMMHNKRYFLDSIGKLENNFDPAMAKAMAKMKDNINLLFSGISENMPANEALEIYERNATAMGIDAGMRQYSKDGIAIGEATRGLGKYTTEFVYGRQFTEWANYIPVFAIENPGIVHVDLTPLQGSADDQVLGDLSDNTNMVTSGLGSTKERSRRLGNSKVLVFNFNAMVEGRTRINVLDYMTASSRRELNNVISSKGNAFPQLANLLKDGGKHGDQGRISHVQKTVRTMWNNSIQNASYISEMQGIANNITNLWAGVKLSSFYQLPAQFASNLMPYFITNATNPQKIARFFEASNILLKYRAGTIKDERLKGTVERLLYAIEARQQDVFLDKSVALDVDGTGMFNSFKNTEIGRNILQGARTLNKVRENVLFWQFKTSDHLSGAPMLLAEYMDREVKAGRAVDWDGLTFNEESYFGSIDEIERFIGIGGASRRGVWLNGKNGWMTLFRNMVSAFSSHRINNATNFRGELFKLMNSDLSTAERMESARYMTAIAGQSALFTVMKASMVGFFYNMLADKMGEEENEKELEAYYEQLISGNYRKEDRKVIEAEISLREKIRNEFKRVKDQATNAEVIGMSMLKDTVANSFVIPAIFDLPVNVVIHAFYDQHEAEAFKKVKAATIEDYKEKLAQAKASRNTSEMIDLQKQISQWESQEAIQLVYPNMSIIPFDGAYGGVLKDGYRFLEKGAGVLMGAESMTTNDMFMGLGLAGIGQADISRISRLMSKQEEFEKEYQESIDKIRAMEEAKNRR